VKRYGFGLSALIVLAGVLLHFPDYVAMEDMHYMMADMDMSAGMTIGMLLTIGGIILGVWSLLPSRAERAVRAMRAPTGKFAALDGAALTGAHRALAGVLTIGLVVDTMKPASLGFVTPGLAAEYGMTTSQAAGLPFVAITGTVIGSLVWGILGDIFGRRSTILISALMYIGTSICGFMPSFEGNLVMCFFMGMSAGGMLPIVFSLMSESIPTRHRGWLLVLQSGLGTTLGYLIASGAASVLAPEFGWRSLWLLGAPTGLLLVVLTRWIPESPRYLLACGRDAEAAEVMARYGVRAIEATDSAETDAPPEQPVPAGQSQKTRRVSALIGLPYRTRTLGIVLYGLGWGAVNWGFVTFLPVFLQATGAGTNASRLLFFSSLFALPATAVAAVLYARWSSRRSMLVYSAGTVAVLLLFSLLSPQEPGNGGLFIGLVGVLLAGIGGMIAMLSPYAAEVYPTTLRATGSGVAAASSKVGGMFGPLLLTSAPRIEALALVCAAPVAAALLALWRTGMETAGQPLVEAVTPTGTPTAGEG